MTRHNFFLLCLLLVVLSSCNLPPTQTDLRPSSHQDAGEMDEVPSIRAFEDIEERWIQVSSATVII